MSAIPLLYKKFLERSPLLKLTEKSRFCLVWFKYTGTLMSSGFVSSDPSISTQVHLMISRVLESLLDCSKDPPVHLAPSMVISLSKKESSPTSLLSQICIFSSNSSSEAFWFMATVYLVAVMKASGKMIPPSQTPFFCQLAFSMKKVNCSILFLKSEIKRLVLVFDGTTYLSHSCGI